MISNAWGYNSAKSIIFIDPSAEFNGDGSLVLPAINRGGVGAYNSWNNIKIKQNTSYYQKCNTIYISNNTINISAQGSIKNNLIIGAYYLEGKKVVIGVKGKKPIIHKDTGYTLFISNTKNLIIENLDIRGGDGAVAFYASSFITLRHCSIGKFSNNLGVLVSGRKINGQYIESNYGVIENCEISSGGENFGRGDGIKLTNGANFWKIRNNKVIDWGHTSIYLHCNESFFLNRTSFNKIYNNKISAPKKKYCRGFETWGSDISKCEYNKIFNNLITDTTVRNQVNGNNNSVYYNVILNVSNSKLKTVGVGQGIDLEGFGNGICRNNKIFNNVIANCDEAGIRLWRGKNIKKGNQIFNNIVYNCGRNSKNGYANIGIVVSKHRSVAQNLIKNNCIYNENSKKNIFYHGSRISINEFNKFGGESNIENNFNFAPMFQNFKKKDFKLQTNSKCINSGMQHSVIKDFFGNPVPANFQSRFKIDIGIHEFFQVSNN